MSPFSLKIMYFISPRWWFFFLSRIIFLSRILWCLHVAKWVFFWILVQMCTVKKWVLCCLPFLLPPSENPIVLPSLEGQNSNAFECFFPRSLFHFFLWKSRETNVLVMTWLPAKFLLVAPMPFSLTKTDPVTLSIWRNAPSPGIWNAPGHSTETSCPIVLS